jgi:hypothetical protein
MQTLLNRIKEALGLKLLSAAMALLPKDAPAHIGAARGLAEQRQYDRYEGYTLLLGAPPIQFDRWREIRSTFFLRMRKWDAA